MGDKLVQTGENLEVTYDGSRKPGGTTLNSVHWLLVRAVGLNILTENVRTIKKQQTFYWSLVRRWV
jgi:hypothetical protein